MKTLIHPGHKATHTAGRACSGLAGRFLAILAIFLTVAPLALGYVLQGPHVLQLMADTLSGGHSLQVRQRVWLAEGSGGATAVEYTETVDYLFPGRFRSNAWYEETNRILVSNYNRTVTVIDGVVVSEQGNRFDAFKELLLHQPRNALARTLIKSGVDVGVASLGLWDETIVFVIGARYPDESVSQVWIEKERFLPVRWINRQAHPSRGGHFQQLEFVYRQWRQHGEIWYPMLIETYLDGRLIRQSRADQVMVNPSGSEDLFDVDSLISMSRPPETPPPEDRALDRQYPATDDPDEKLQP